jgi:Zn-dependent protease with chaperone function
VNQNPGRFSPPAVDATYFDGLTTRRHGVRLTLLGDVLHMDGDSASRVAALRQLRISEPMGRAPRLITFPDGTYCEVRDHARLAQLLGASGHRERAHIRWQFDLRMVLASLALFVGLGFAAYFVGLPAAAEWAAPAVPDGVRKAISQQTLDFIDGGLMSASRLPAERVRPIVEGFGKLRPPGGGGPVGHRVLFRNGGRLGANALALPDGTLIVTDQLVKLSSSDDDVIAVLTHELGHVARHHGLRMVFQSSLVGVFLTWYVGDVSSLLAAAPAVLLEARYSRGMESEADAYGAAMLRDNGMSPGLLADMLERLEAASKGKDKGGDVPDYLGSHPDTGSRVRSLRGG